MVRMTTYTTTQVRTALGDLFDRTRLTGEHFKIVRKSKTQGYVVPPAWYEQARAAMGDPLGVSAEDGTTKGAEDVERD